MLKHNHFFQSNETSFATVLCMELLVESKSLSFSDVHVQQMIVVLTSTARVASLINVELMIENGD